MTQISLSEDSIKEIIAEKYNTQPENVKLQYFHDEQNENKFIQATVIFQNN